MRTKTLWPLTVAAALICFGSITHADELADTAIEALHAVPRDGIEHAAAIYSLEGVLHVSEFHSSGSSRGVAAYRILVPRGSRVVALVHNHPAEGENDHSEVFTSADIEAAKALNVPSFIIVEKTGQVLRYVPGDKVEAIPSFDRFLPHAGLVARGTVVSP